MADVFISYSRKDKAFVRRLDEALTSRGRDTWVDWEGIRPSEEFMLAIFAAIEGADSVVFVLSPDSINSDICRREIAHAAQHNKRMVPIVARDVDASAVPEPLAKLNWIFAREADDFESAANLLIAALETDLTWIRAHTRVLARAVEWDANRNSNSFVLRGEDLQAAEQWLAQAGAAKERQPTELQTRYIIASRKAAAKRQRTVLGAVTAGLVVALVLAAMALLARQRAEEAREAAQNALTRGFVRTIGTSEENSPPSPEERATLWELAELEPANAPVRAKVLEHWLENHEALLRGCRRNGQGLRAAIGLNITRRNSSSARLHALLRLTAASAHGQNGGIDLPQPEELLPAVETWLNPRDIGRVVRLLSAAAADPRQRHRERLTRLTDAVGELAPHVEPGDAASVAGDLIALLENPQKRTTSGQRAMADTFVALAPRLEPHDAISAADRLLKVLESSPTTDGYSIWRTGRCLDAIVRRSAPKDSPVFAARTAHVILQALEQSTGGDGEIVPLLGSTLAALTDQMKSADAAHLCHRAALVVLRRMDLFKSGNPYRSLSVSVLSGLISRMAPPDVAGIADRLVEQLETEHGFDAARLSLLNDIGTALAARPIPEQAAKIAGRIARLIEHPQVTDAAHLSQLGEALGKWAPRVQPDDAAKFASRGSKRLAAILENSDGMNDSRRSDVVNALASLGPFLPSQDAEVIAAPVWQLLENTLETPGDTDAFALHSLGHALAAFAPSTSTVAVTERLVVLLETSTGNKLSQLSSLAPTVAALAASLDAQSANMLTRRSADTVLPALEASSEAGARNEPSRLSDLADVLAILAARMEPADAAVVSLRGARILAAALADPQFRETSDRATVAWSLGKLSLFIPRSRKTELVAMSELLTMNEFPLTAREEDRRGEPFAKMCAGLAAQDLAEVLKWPFGGKEARAIARGEMEKKTGRKFGGNIWSFVEQAPECGITAVDAPAQRPRIEDALAELQSLGGAVTTVEP